MYIANFVDVNPGGGSRDLVGTDAHEHLASCHRGCSQEFAIALLQIRGFFRVFTISSWALVGALANTHRYYRTVNTHRGCSLDLSGVQAHGDTRALTGVLARDISRARHISWAVTGTYGCSLIFRRCSSGTFEASVYRLSLDLSGAR